LREDCFHIEGIPQHQGIHHQPERAELILLALSVPLAEFAALAMKDGTSDAVAPLTAVELGENAPSIGLVINVRQLVEGLGYTP
jgi:hypothetical protein